MCLRALAVWMVVFVGAVAVRAEETNLARNPSFEEKAGQRPAGYELSGDVEYRFMGVVGKDASSWGVALQSGKDLNRDGKISGEVSQYVTIDTKLGRWFRFSFRGLPEDHFGVRGNHLNMKVAFFGDGGKTAYDAKEKPLYEVVQQARKDLTVNGDHHVGGAAVWRTYAMDFYVPFPQVNQLRLSVGFSQGAAQSATDGEFFVDDFSLTRIDAPVQAKGDAAPATEKPSGNLVGLGGRWYFRAKQNEKSPAQFDYSNAGQLLYFDGQWSTPFVENMSSWLRAGEKDLSGQIALADQLIEDNVTVRFDGTSMIIHTHGLPNHPTGKFPENGFGREFNPNYIAEKDNTYFFPLNPQVNSQHVVTTADNSNHALNMGPIGLAVNGVVFFNPFDANSEDATNMMDRCCGHPAPDSTYHYHKYPICVNSPWADEGEAHSPLIGWAFDGFPIYGPYEAKDVMAKDVSGEGALNGFNMHYDKDRGWHYHVTPGKFPYLIGGYWGTADARDVRRGGRGPRMGGGPGGRPPMGGGPGMGPPPPMGQ